MSRIHASSQQLQEAYDAVRNDPQWEESCQLIAEGHAPSEMFQALATRPDILRALSALSAPLYPGGLLERDLKERVIVQVSEANECQYCTASHQGTLQRRGIAQDAPLTDRERAAHAYVEAAVLNPPQVTDALWESTRQHFSDGELVELTLLIGLTAMLNRLNDCLGVRYNGEYDRIPAP